MTPTSLDLVIIGSGPGGYRAAVLGSLRGLSVALIERGVWGGTCLNRGCVPKKTWYDTARVVASRGAWRARGLNGDVCADLDEVWCHQRGVVETVRASYIDYLQQLGVTSLSGEAGFVDGHTVEVAGVRLRPKHVIIASGSSPQVPGALPLQPGRVLTTDELFDYPPPAGRRVAVVGSGVIGTEMAFILTLLGCDVAWLMNADPLASEGYSAPAHKLLREALAEHGIAPRVRSRPVSCSVDAGGVTLALPDGSAERVDWVLVAAGRSPNTADLALERAGVACDKLGFVRTDAELRTTAPDVFAIGDCAHPEMTANDALADAAVAITNILSPGAACRDATRVPRVVYSALELARFGLSEDLAEAAGNELAIGYASLQTNPAALAAEEPRGFVRLVADHETGRLLGVEAVGRSAGEWIHAAVACADRDGGLRALADLHYNHPSLAEEFRNATDALAAKWGLADVVFGAPE